MQKLTIIGNLTSSPETRATNSGKTVCSFTVAVDRRFSGSGGEKVTDFFRCNAWNKLGENCAKYLAKGKKVAVVGELQARTYAAKDGTTRMSLDVAADEVEFLSPRSDASTEGRAAADGQAFASFTDIQSDDIPF